MSLFLSLPLLHFLPLLLSLSNWENIISVQVRQLLRSLVERFASVFAFASFPASWGSLTTDWSFAIWLGPWAYPALLPCPASTHHYPPPSADAAAAAACATVPRPSKLPLLLPAVKADCSELPQKTNSTSSLAYSSLCLPLPSLLLMISNCQIIVINVGNTKRKPHYTPHNWAPFNGQQNCHVAAI